MKMRTLVLVAAFSAAGSFAQAQGIAIADDGWSRVDRTAKLDYTVEIADDGWTKGEKSKRLMSAPRVAGSKCSQLETSLGHSGSQCGTMTTSQLSREYTARHN